MERLDKVLSSGGIFTRSECKKAVLKGRIQVNGKRVKSPDEKVDASVDEIIVDGERITINKFVYIMLNKPVGYVTTVSDDPKVLSGRGCFLRADSIKTRWGL